MHCGHSRGQPSVYFGRASALSTSDSQCQLSGSQFRVLGFRFVSVPVFQYATLNVGLSSALVFLWS